MSGTEIHSSRIQPLNRVTPRKGNYVLYWMQQSQRAEGNHALEYAIQLANDVGLPCLVCFGLTDNYPEANYRHYRFMLEGLSETAKTLESRGIQLILRKGNPDQIALDLSAKAAMMICDRGYIRHQRMWRERVSREASCPVIQVESDVVVPIETVSSKAEYAARTIRPKIQRLLDGYLIALSPTLVKHPSLSFSIESLPINDIEALLDSLQLDRTVDPVTTFSKGGTTAAKMRLDTFIANYLNGYSQNSNRPEAGAVSRLSPYLHFGQISPVDIALQIRKTAEAPATDLGTFLEELIVRRELAANFTYYTPNYDHYGCIPKWAQSTLNAHLKDRRQDIYGLDVLEKAQTHDPYWNAAMREMKYTGFMHNYMRMYWGKKIIEWSRTPMDAFQSTLFLNNRYFIDGRDPNSYTGVAWLYGVHDRPWKERPIFGKIRYMAASGLERKCDIAAYVKWVDSLVNQSV
jgi:deoxyribodipyrimidine photo-lyase